MEKNMETTIGIILLDRRFQVTEAASLPGKCSAAVADCLRSGYPMVSEKMNI